MNKFFITLISILLSNSSFAQWTKISSIPQQEMVAIANMNDTLYAASGTNLLYKSIDSGISWQELIISNQDINVYTLKIIENKIYIGTTNDGIFVSNDFGITWVNYNNAMPTVSGFVKFNTVLYASTIGNGVYKYDALNDTWGTFNNQLPSNLAYGVEAITTTPNKLIIAAGANGVNYQYDFISNQWNYYYYYGILSPGLQIIRLINQSDILYAMDGRRIIRSNDGGTNWSNDNFGSHNGVDRNAFVGSTHVYTITNLITGGTWIQKRSKSSPIGTNWNVDEAFVATGYSYDIFEFNNKLFLAKDDGLYVKDLLLSVDNSNNIVNEFKVFPNPAKEGKINIISPIQVNKIYLLNSLGQYIYMEEPQSTNFNIDYILKETGVYFIIAYFNNTSLIVSEKIIIE